MEEDFQDFEGGVIWASFVYCSRRPIVKALGLGCEGSLFSSMSI